MPNENNPFLGRTSVSFGPLEEKILRELCSRGSATVRELISDGTLKLAYTTVMTTMDRLYKKGLLDRAGEGKAYRYSPRYSLGEIQRLATLESLRVGIGLADSSSLLLSNLVDTLSQHDVRLLEELEHLVERKREQLKKERP